MLLAEHHHPNQGRASVWLPPAVSDMFPQPCCRIRTVRLKEKFWTPRCSSRPQFADSSPGKIQAKALGIGVAIAGAGSVALVYAAVLLSKKKHGLRAFLSNHMPSGCSCLRRNQADVVLSDKASSSNVPGAASCDPLPKLGEKPSQAETLSAQPF